MTEYTVVFSYNDNVLEDTVEAPDPDLAADAIQYIWGGDEDWESVEILEVNE